MYRVDKEFKGLKEFKELKVLWEFKVPKVLVYKVFRVGKVFKELRE